MHIKIINFLIRIFSSLFATLYLFISYGLMGLFTYSIVSAESGGSGGAAPLILMLIPLGILGAPWTLVSIGIYELIKSIPYSNFIFLIVPIGIIINAFLISGLKRSISDSFESNEIRNKEIIKNIIISLLITTLLCFGIKVFILVVCFVFLIYLITRVFLKLKK